MSPTVKNARATLDKAQAEVSRVSEAIEIHAEKLEGLRAGLVPPPDRAGELSELLAAVALGEATDKDVAALRAVMAKEAESTNKRNASDISRIGELEAQLSGLRSRLAKAEDAETAAHRALHDAALADIAARLKADSSKLLEHFKAIGDLFPRLLAESMLLDQTDREGRFGIIKALVRFDVAGWPEFLSGKPSDAEIYAMSEHGANRATHDRFQAAVDELAALGVELRP